VDTAGIWRFIRRFDRKPALRPCAIERYDLAVTASFLCTATACLVGQLVGEYRNEKSPQSPPRLIGVGEHALFEEVMEETLDEILRIRRIDPLAARKGI
jgi:hypothetical protein